MLPLATAANPSLSIGRDVLLALAGAGAGFCNSVAGGGTLVSFPALLGMGYPALTANVTSSAGIWAGLLSGAAGFRNEIAGQRARIRSLAGVAMGGALAGSILLLTTPPRDFELAAPWLILFASLLFALRPLLGRLLGDGPTANRQASPSVADESPGGGRPTADLAPSDSPRQHRALLVVGTLLAAVYGGYFGAGMSVILLAILGLALPGQSLIRTFGLRTALAMLVNAVAAVVFMVHSSLAWSAVGLLAVGSLAGGYVGARVARRVPAWLLRVAVVGIGTATGIRLLV